MRKVIVGLSLFLTVSLLPAYSATPPKAGSICSKQGVTKTYQAKKFTCIKSGKKLIWSKGVTIQVIATPTPTTSSSSVSEPSLEPCTDAVSIRKLNYPVQVVSGQRFELEVDATSNCAIDKVYVNLVSLIGGDLVNNFGGWANQTLGNKKSGTWKYSLYTTEKTPAMSLDLYLTFYSCPKDSAACSASKGYYDEICSTTMTKRYCKSERRVEIIPPKSYSSLPKINTTLRGGALYCGITNSDSWDYKADFKKINVISVLTWIFPSGETTVWDRNSTNWAEGTLISGLRYRISSNIEAWADAGGLPTLRLNLLNSSGQMLGFESSEFKGKVFTCKFQTTFKGESYSTQSTQVIP